MPTALQCKRAIKGSQFHFVTDCKWTTYTNDSNEFVLDFCAEKRKGHHELPSLREKCIEPPTKRMNTSATQFSVQTFELNEFSEWIFCCDANSIFYLAGSTTNSVFKHVSDKCVEFLTLSNVPVNQFIQKQKEWIKVV